MTDIRCIVFDFDGVLVDSNAIKRDAYRQVLAERGATTELLKICLAERQDGDRTEIITELLRRLSSGADGADVARFVGAYSRVCLEGISTCREIAGASAALDALHAEYPLYVNSATPEEPLRAIVTARGWSHYFRGVLGRPSSKRENLKRIQNAEGISADAMLFIGDRQADMDAARGCGCAFVGIRSDESDFSTPARDVPLVIASLEQLPAIVRGLRRQ